MRGDEVLEHADVVVTDGRIAAVGADRSGRGAGRRARPSTPPGTTVVPGLIDTHAHLHYSAFEVFPETKWEYLTNLAYGVTTIYDPSAPTVDVFAQAEMVEAGRMVGPRVYSSGMVLYGGQQTDIWAAVDSQEDARPPGEADEGLGRAHDQGLPAAAPLAAALVRRGVPQAEDAAHRRGRRASSSPT